MSMLDRMAGANSHLINASLPSNGKDGESYLAFEMLPNGQPLVAMEFRTDRDRMALLLLAQTVVSEMCRKVGSSILGSLDTQEGRGN